MVLPRSRAELRVPGQNVREGVQGQGDEAGEKVRVKRLKCSTEEFGFSPELYNHKISLKFGMYSIIHIKLVYCAILAIC